MTEINNITYDEYKQNDETILDKIITRFWKDIDILKTIVFNRKSLFWFIIIILVFTSFDVITVNRYLTRSSHTTQYGGEGIKGFGKAVDAISRDVRDGAIKGVKGVGRIGLKGAKGLGRIGLKGVKGLGTTLTGIGGKKVNMVEEDHMEC